MPYIDKIEHISNSVMKEANEKAQELLKEITRIKESILSKADDEALKRSYEEIKQAVDNIRKEGQKEIAENHRQYQKELILIREELVDKIFQAVKDRVEQYTQTEQYTEFLKRILEKHKGINCKVLCRAKDCDKMKDLRVDFSVDDSIIYGGIKLLCEDEAIIINETLDDIMEEEFKRFAQFCDFHINLSADEQE